MWNNVRATEADGSTLRAIGIDGWEHGASSFETIENGEDGFVEFTSYENDAYKMAGLSHGDEDTHFGDIDYAIYLRDDGQFSILESGNQKGSFGAYAAGDVFRVEVVNDEVRYYKNGSVVYESATTPDYPLLLDASIYSVGGTIVDASLELI